MKFEFATAGRVLFGQGVLQEAGPAARSLGQRAWVVIGRDRRRAEPLLTLLAAHQVAYSLYSVAGEPRLENVSQGARLAREHGCDLVIGLGGGSVLDAAKAIAALMNNEGDLLDYVEVIGRGRALQRPSAPFLAIPTTAGTGTEATRNAVLASPEHRLKVSLRSPWLLPTIAIVDPELTLGLPPALTAATGMDALTQLIEPYTCARANPLVDALCVDGLPRIARALPRAFDCGNDLEARQEMSLAALYSGMALANAGLGAVHGLAAPVGGMFPAPHGAVCAALLPHVMAVNLRALRQRAPASPVLPRLGEIARLLTGNPQAGPEDGVAWVAALARRLGIPPLHSYQLTPADVPALVEKAAKASSMKANPIALTPAELTEILQAAW